MGMAKQINPKLTLQMLQNHIHFSFFQKGRLKFILGIKMSVVKSSESPVLLLDKNVAWDAG